jgi:hypothetical protein
MQGKRNCINLQITPHIVESNIIYVSLCHVPNFGDG